MNKLWKGVIALSVFFVMFCSAWKMTDEIKRPSYKSQFQKHLIDVTQMNAVTKEYPVYIMEPFTSREYIKVNSDVFF